jgi:gliding motility-associated-like protein
MDTATFLVMVTDTTPPVIIPNIFSPNGDNVNDLFTIKGKGLTYFDCVVYDRWGIEMYSWSDISGGWDGKNQANGKSVSDGTYYVLVTYIDKRGKLGVAAGALGQNGFKSCIRYFCYISGLIESF